MTCNTCRREDHSPAREYNVDGTIRTGCVDSFHNGRLVPKDAAWHSRPEAVRIRRRMSAFQK